MCFSGDRENDLNGQNTYTKSEQADVGWLRTRTHRDIEIATTRGGLIAIDRG